MADSEPAPKFAPFLGMVSSLLLGPEKVSGIDVLKGRS